MISPQSTAPDLKTRLKDFLGDDLSQVNAIMKKQLRSSSDFVSDVTEHASRFQGKQVRPILLLLMHRVLTGASSENALKLAAAMELIHTATLVHDDVIDGAKTRRHVATVHHRWNAETSVLLGDYLFSKAFHLTATTGDAEACRLIGRATDRTCEGEMNQSAHRLNNRTTELDYFRIIRDKTGQLFAVSCLLGARSGGAAPEQLQAAHRFGLRLGYAFQIADDVLDLTADGETTGKDQSNDLHNGRLTLPLIRALRLADQAGRSELLRMLANPADDPAPLIRQTCVRQGLESAARTAHSLATRAIRDLQRFPECSDREILTSLAEFTVQRSG